MISEMKDLVISKNRFQQNFNTLRKHRFLLPRVFDAYIKKVFLKKDPIRLVEIAIGYECNARCEQCSCALSLDKKRKRLTLPEFKKLIDDSIKLGAFQFNLTGGEPLIYPHDTYELIKYIRKKGCYVHLCTNGILLDQKKLKKLKGLGLNSLEFGLDSAEKRIHDANRQKGAYKKVMEATMMAQKLGVTVIWDTIITHEKIKNEKMMALVKLAKKKGAILQITPPCMMGRWSKKKEILLDDKEKEYFKRLLTKPWARTDTYSSFLRIGCPAVKEKFAVNPYGDVLPCSLIQISYGNIRQESLEEIHKKMQADPFYHGKGGVFTCLPSFSRKFIKERLQ